MASQSKPITMNDQNNNIVQNSNGLAGNVNNDVGRTIHAGITRPTYPTENEVNHYHSTDKPMIVVTRMQSGPYEPLAGFGSLTNSARGALGVDYPFDTPPANERLSTYGTSSTNFKGSLPMSSAYDKVRRANYCCGLRAAGNSGRLFNPYTEDVSMYDTFGRDYELTGELDYTKQGYELVRDRLLPTGPVVERNVPYQLLNTGWNQPAVANGGNLYNYIMPMNQVNSSDPFGVTGFGIPVSANQNSVSNYQSSIINMQPSHYGQFSNIPMVFVPATPLQPQPYAAQEAQQQRAQQQVLQQVQHKQVEQLVQHKQVEQQVQHKQVEQLVRHKQVEQLVQHKQVEQLGLHKQVEQLVQHKQVEQLVQHKKVEPLVQNKQVEQPVQHKKVEPLVQHKQVEQPVQHKKVEPLVQHKQVEQLVQHKHVEQPVQHKKVEPLVQHKQVEQLVQHKHVEQLVQHKQVEQLVQHKKVEPLVQHKKVEPLVQHKKVEPLVQHKQVEQLVQHEQVPQQQVQHQQVPQQQLQHQQVPQQQVQHQQVPQQQVQHQEVQQEVQQQPQQNVGKMGTSTPSNGSNETASDELTQVATSKLALFSTEDNNNIIGFGYIPYIAANITFQETNPSDQFISKLEKLESNHVENPEEFKNRFNEMIEKLNGIIDLLNEHSQRIGNLKADFDSYKLEGEYSDNEEQSHDEIND